MQSRLEKDVEIDTALEQLAQEGLLSDQRFAEAYTSSRKNRGFGPVRIRIELRDKGVSDILIEEALSDVAEAFITLAEETRIKRFGSEKPKDFKEKAKQIKFLQYKGFTEEQIKHYEYE